MNPVAKSFSTFSITALFLQERKLVVSAGRASWWGRHSTYALSLHCLSSAYLLESKQRHPSFNRGTSQSCPLRRGQVLSPLLLLWSCPLLLDSPPPAFGMTPLVLLPLPACGFLLKPIPLDNIPWLKVDLHIFDLPRLELEILFSNNKPMLQP